MQTKVVEYNSAFIMIRYAFLFVFIWSAVASCNSPSSRIQHMQQELLRLLQDQSYYELKSGKNNFKLPLPPSAEQQQRAANTLLDFQNTLASFPVQQLDAADSVKLLKLRHTLAELNRKSGAGMFDPVRCVLSADLIRTLETSSETRTALFQHITDYYAAVEQKWSAPAPERAKIAALQTGEVLLQLESLQAPAATLRALKDFIALCRSAAMLQ